MAHPTCHLCLGCLLSQITDDLAHYNCHHLCRNNVLRLFPPQLHCLIARCFVFFVLLSCQPISIPPKDKMISENVSLCFLNQCSSMFLGLLMLLFSFLISLTWPLSRAPSFQDSLSFAQKHSRQEFPLILLAH